MEGEATWLGEVQCQRIFKSIHFIHHTYIHRKRKPYLLKSKIGASVSEASVAAVDGLARCGPGIELGQCLHALAQPHPDLRVQVAVLSPPPGRVVEKETHPALPIPGNTGTPFVVKLSFLLSSSFLLS